MFNIIEVLMKVKGGKKMLDKFSLTDRECENIAKGIALGVGIGIVIGAIVGNIVLTFSAGGVVGILVSLAYSFYEKHKEDSIEKL